MTPEQRAAIAAEIATERYAGKPRAEIAALLCEEPQIPNPTPQGQVIRTIPLDAALAAMSDASLTKLINTPLMSDFIDACKGGDMASAKRLMTLGVRTGQIQPAEAQALAALDGMIPDPNWPATVAGPSRLEQLTGLRAITTEELAEILG